MLVTNHPHREQYVPLELLALRPEFRKLNLAQQKFVSCFLAIGYPSGTYDAVRAVTKAYGKPKKPLKNAKIRAYQILNNRHVRRVLDTHFHRSDLDVLLSDIQHAAKKSDKLGLLAPAVAKALLAFEKYVTEHSS